MTIRYASMGLSYRSPHPLAADAEPVVTMNGYSVHRLASGHAAGAAAYFVSPETACGIISVQTPISTPVDHWVALRDAGAFQDVFLVHAQPSRIAAFASTIEYDGRFGLKRVPPLFSASERLLRRLHRALRALRGKTHYRISHWA